ncbi:unnamed protein product [Mesocestoides corti]|uniref:Peptidase S8/S53 domain-containing protein n=1 Tax=Mesocestoides corti TaxID=53468 RepID=A0A0R3UI47_MESCO|nr:unnamed protein product [Mesocestoides corti]
MKAKTVDLNQNDLNLLTSRLLRSEFIKNVHKDKVIHLHVSQLRQDPNRKKSKKNPLPNDQAADSVLLNPKNQPWKLLSAPQAAWSTGLCGDGVRVGIFDTGLVNAYHYSHFRNANIVERTNWTWRLKNAKVDTNPSAVDGHGHGTFVSGLIAASIPDLKETSFSDDSCLPLGLAPHAELYIFRVFTDSQFSMTSWFLDALNYAIAKRLHVINLSIGGPDFMDQPFVDKVNELSANGILMVSAIGNDGPVFGSPNNPADQMDVLGVGGVDALGNVATFSSRGPTAWEMRDGYGRFKPDIVTWATGVISSNLDGGCKSLSGTSAASPVVTGSVALLINAALSHRPEGRDAPCPSGCPPINPASLKQAIMAGAGPISVEGRKTASIFEQGAGMLNLQRSIDVSSDFSPVFLVARILTCYSETSSIKKPDMSGGCRVWFWGVIVCVKIYTGPQISVVGEKF